eukprot:TRINITY_DN914_c0_g1_i1.p2 TRINITY_DN914_c0_g1~~TRINITY_DN914_c0_g1_i1.p2  ORF type:complete len:103 (-),score=26.14 TRINITY_DN914_c0_g1_i1:75-383(-)
MAIGARSQSAKTYLERNYNTFADASLEDLIRHALFALRETTQSSSDGLTTKNCAIGVVGIDRTFEIIEGARLQPYLSVLDAAPASTSASTPVPAAEGERMED